MAEEERVALSKLASKDAVLDALLSAHDAGYVKDRDGCYLMVNEAGASSLGFAAESLVGKTDQEVFPGELGERRWGSDQAIMASGQPQTLEEPVIVAGALRTHLTTKVPLR